MRGRRPSGPAYVERVSGSEQAKQRARVVLETMTGQCRVLEACERLNVSEPRLQQLRSTLVTAAVASQEPGHAGRPRRTVTPEQAEITALKQQVADMEVALKAAEARAEIALILPKAVQPPARPDQPEPEKKTRRQPKSQRSPMPDTSARSPLSSRRRRSGTRKNT
ncbi:MAG TPA: hypothetical protein VGY66_00620 [Gemmataceae bacterium]|jgi:hypothetical protein|nr:hypothetical protein [Gemmataceae bacterium]